MAERGREEDINVRDRQHKRQEGHTTKVYLYIHTCTPLVPHTHRVSLLIKWATTTAHH